MRKSTTRGEPRRHTQTLRAHCESSISSASKGSVYVTETDDMANLFAALLALKALPWFPLAVRDIRGFRIENWSDFTPIIKGAEA